MLFRNRLLLLTMVLTVAVAYAVAAPAPQAGQDIRITNGPVIEEATSNAAVIAWSTDVPSSSQVWYGTEKNNLTHSAEAPDNGSKTHRVRIANLKPNTTYYFQVESSQRHGNRGEAESAGVRSFKTTAPGAHPVHNQNAQLVENDRQAGDVEGGKVKITNGPVVEEVRSERSSVTQDSPQVFSGSISKTTGGSPPLLLARPEARHWAADLSAPRNEPATTTCSHVPSK